MSRFADDSASADSSPLNRSQMPIVDVVSMDQMNLEIEEFMEQEDLDQMLQDFTMTAEEMESDENGLVKDYGLENPQIVTFFKKFKSAKKYKAEMVKYCRFDQAQPDSSEENLIVNMVKYFEQSYLDKTVDDSASADGLLEIKKRASTTLRGVFSVLKKMWQYTGRGNLTVLAPLVTDLLSQWDKEHRTKQSATFSKKNIEDLLIMPDDPKTLLWKAYSVISLALAGRGKESYNVLTEDVTRVQDEEGKVSYQIAFDRVKMLTTTTTDRSLAVVTGHLEVRTLEAYVALRPAGLLDAVQKKTKFFRKINKPTAQGKLKQSWSAQNIGVASLASIARDIAKALGLENWTQFSGHAWRRTAITFGVNAGMTLPQIKSMSGHHSDTVVQGYIDRGMPMKLMAAEATSVSGGTFGARSALPCAMGHYSAAPQSHGYPLTKDADMPYWPSLTQGRLPKYGSAPLDPRNDKRVKRQGNENVAPIYNFNITVTGDVNAPLHLNAGQGSSSDL
ncbi:hypothetical protein B484DRAFT_455816 [Ochromonadaceae sp. CCMP2298]|nr:hypothetical protein B484DRAFT_455816 [Ochromonadaceae sp. CCMP2298]